MDAQYLDPSLFHGHLHQDSLFPGGWESEVARQGRITSFSRLLLQVLQRMRSVFTVGTIAVIVGGVICAKKHGVFARYY